jgi:hypothetical protein
MTVNERMLLLREVTMHATHIAHHHNPGDEYSRDQAKVVLGCVMSLMELD